MILDELDHSILEHLQANARISFAELGRTVGLTPPAVAQRVHKMEREGLVLGYNVQLDYAKLGYNMTALITVKLALGNMPAFKKALSEIKEVLECYRVTGEDCMILKVMLKDNAHLIDVVDRLVALGNTKTSIILTNMLEQLKK